MAKTAFGNQSFIRLAEQKKKFFNYLMILFMVSGLMAIMDIFIDFAFNHF